MIKRLLLLMSLLLMFALVFVPVSASASLHSLLAPKQLCPGQLDGDAAPAAQDQVMLCLINYARKTRGLQALHTQPQLGRSSEAKAKAIYRCHQFSHSACGRDFTSWFRAAGYMSCGCSWEVGENIAWLGDDSGYQALTPRATMNAWIHSPEHRANILKPGWHDANVAVIKRPFSGYDDAVIWVSQFGRRG